jgi:hypothetical protein
VNSWSVLAKASACVDPSSSIEIAVLFEDARFIQCEDKTGLATAEEEYSQRIDARQWSARCGLYCQCGYNFNTDKTKERFLTWQNRN